MEIDLGIKELEDQELEEIRHEETASEEAVAELIFRRLDRREYIPALVSEGGEGQVCRIVEERDSVNVTLKSILLSGIKDGSELERLDREWEVVRTLSHPGIVRYRGRETRQIPRRSGIDVEYSLLADWVEGEPLSTVLQKESYTEEKVAAVLEELLDTVGYLHDNKVFHRDLKPSNIIRRPDGGLTVIDFGLVKKVGMTTMTASEGRFLGSIPYAAPEVLEGKPATMAADLYSLGVIGAALLRGKEFTYRDHPGDIRQKVAALGIHNRKLKETLDALLEENPKERMKHFALVDGRYVFGVVEESRGFEKRKIAEEKNQSSHLKEEFFPDYLNALTIGILSGIFGFGVGRVLSALNLEIPVSDINDYAIFSGIATGGIGAFIGGTYNHYKSKIRNYHERRKAEKEQRLEKRFVSEIATLTGNNIQAVNGQYNFQHNGFDIAVKKEDVVWEVKIENKMVGLYNVASLREKPKDVARYIVDCTPNPFDEIAPPWQD